MAWEQRIRLHPERSGRSLTRRAPRNIRPALWGKARQTGVVTEVDLSFLPEDHQLQAIRTSSGEVMWPRRMASDVVQVLAANGRVVLGLDLRSDGTGTIPTGFATEVPWSNASRVHGDRLSPEVARDEALSALQRPDLAEMDGYDWVLISWAGPQRSLLLLVGAFGGRSQARDSAQFGVAGECPAAVFQRTRNLGQSH